MKRAPRNKIRGCKAVHHLRLMFGVFMLLGLLGPTERTFAQGVAKLQVNRIHGIAVMSDGRAMTWGDNNRGQLGRGDTSPVNEQFSPTVLSGINNAIDAAAGVDFTLLLLADGTVMAWGEAEGGQLGLGEPGVLPRPGTAMKQALSPTRITGLKGVRQVAAGETFSLALLEDGTVMAWGASTAGVLGDGKGTARGETEYRVPFPQKVEGLSGVKSIAAGSDIALAIMEDGTVRGWGSNQYGQMGVEGERFIATPSPIPGLIGVRSVHGGIQYAMAVLEDGTVRVWGRNTCSVFGDGSQPDRWVTTPQPVPGLQGVVELRLGTCHAVALLEDGTVRVWGHSGFGQHGAGSGDYVHHLAKPRLTGVQGIAAGGYRSYFLMPNGQLLIAGFVRGDVHANTPQPFATLR